MKFETIYSIGSIVRIKELNRNGRIVRITVGDIGFEYQVRYFDCSRAETVYFFEDEIELVA